MRGFILLMGFANSEAKNILFRQRRLTVENFVYFFERHAVKEFVFYK